jgi:hypothetical protein
MKNSAEHSKLHILACCIAKHEVPAKTTIDVVVENHGSIFLFRPLTANAEQWIEENVSREGFHPNWPSLLVEYRYAHDLATGMRVSGLVVR